MIVSHDQEEIIWEAWFFHIIFLDHSSWYGETWPAKKFLINARK